VSSRCTEKELRHFIVSDFFWRLLTNFSLYSPKVKRRLEIIAKLRDAAFLGNDSSLAVEFKYLLDRESDMLRRGRPSATMMGLRKRICHLFYQLVVSHNKLS